jgi:serine phosphatase RsbU (regulator of sigma subunit)
MRINFLLTFVIILLFACSREKNSSISISDDENLTLAKTDASVIYKQRWTELFSNPKEGNPYITHFEINKNLDSHIFSIIQDNSQVMYFANRQGILSFDGTDWRMIETPSMPFALHKDSFTGEIYVGTASGFGKLLKDKKGALVYNSLSDSLKGIGAVTQICNTKDFIFFQGDQFTVKFKKDKSLAKLWRAGYAASFLGIITRNEEVFVNLSGKGLHKLSDNDATDLKLSGTNLYKIKKMGFPDENFISIKNDSSNFSTVSISFSFIFDQGRYLIGASDNNLYLFDGRKITPYYFEGKGFIADNILVCGIDLSDSEFALGTASGGAIVVDKSNGKTIFNLNYQTGLPDDEIFVLGSDQNKGLWINHPLGLSRVNFSLPVKNYSSYPGLSGNLATVSQYHNTVYVGTTNGLFYLSEVKDLKEINTYIKIPSIIQVDEEASVPNISNQKQEEKIKISKKTTATTTVASEQKKGWLSKLLSKKTEANQTTATGQGNVNESLQIEQIIQPTDIQQNTTQKTRIKNKIVTRKEYAIRSIRRVFKRIDGISDKCKQIIPVNGRLLVATTTAVYEIKENKAIPILRGRSVNQVTGGLDKNRFFVSLKDGIVSLYYYPVLSKWMVEDNFSDFPVNITSAAQTSVNTLWLGSESSAFQIELDSAAFPMSIKPYAIKSRFHEPIIVRKNNGQPAFFCSSGTYSYDAKSDKLVMTDSLSAENKRNYRLLYQQDSLTWVFKSGDWSGNNVAEKLGEFGKSHLKLFDELADVFVDGQKNLWVVNKNQLLQVLNLDSTKVQPSKFDVYIKGLSDNSGKSFDLSEISLEYSKSSVAFKVSAPFYIKHNSNVYQYLIEGAMPEWTDWSNNTTISLFSLIPPGKYKLMVRAKNIFGKISATKSIDFEVEAPLYMRSWFWIMILIILLAIAFGIAKYREKALVREKRILEQKVAERTAKVEKQKKEILDSIKYASRIQQAILPQPELLNKIPFEHFILFKPRDVVSGDFYYFAQQGNKYLVIAGDCTGHGVPGAFMSMLGTAFLNEIVQKQNLDSSDKILNSLRQNVIVSLHQTGKKEEPRDGMDMALIILDPVQKKIQYSGANSSMLLIRNGIANEFKPSKMPIGYHFGEMVPFTSINVDLQKNDMVYIYSDGYSDQFGGPKGKKFLIKNFRELLCKIYDKPVEEQEKILYDTHLEWRGINGQIDDILVIGIRI